MTPNRTSAVDRRPQMPDGKAYSCDGQHTGAIFRSTCELPHIMGGEKCARPFVAKHKRQRGCTMRTFIGPAVLVAIGLMWSVAAMSKLVRYPVRT